MIRIVSAKEMSGLLARRAARLSEAEEAVRPILEAVRQRGDAAVLECARQFDDFERDRFEVSGSELKAARDRLSPVFCEAIRAASSNIRAFAERQVPREHFGQIAPGLEVGQMIRPLGTIAAYIPAGRYPLPSTLMMTVIPAQVAGVPNVCVTCPRAVDEIFGTAALLGVNRVFQIGGAHAIAAFAYGTETIPKADRIVGPGNIYVAAAKKLLAGEVGIDFVAGPTEILIIAAEGEPRFLAADMLAQAEHDTDASAILLTTSRELAAAVSSEIERQLGALSTEPVARVAIERNSAIAVVDSLAEALEISNRFAPEHLSIPDASWLPGVVNAGSVFVGPHSPEAAGDYAAGPNHVLPTGGAARLRGGLSVTDFVKVISVQRISSDALNRLAGTVTTLARSEGLEAHARSIEVRTGCGTAEHA